MIKICSNLKHCWKALLVALVAIVFFFFGSSQVLAESIPVDPDYPSLSPKNSLIISKYVETSQTDIQTNGAAVTVNRMTGNNRPYWGTDCDGTELVFNSPSEMEKAQIKVQYAKPVGTFGGAPIYAYLFIHDIKAQPDPPVYVESNKLPRWKFSDKLYDGFSTEGVLQFRVDLSFTDANGNSINIGAGNKKSYVTINSLNQAGAQVVNGKSTRILMGNEFVNYEKMGILPYYKRNDSILQDYTSPWSSDPVIGGHRDAQNVMDNAISDQQFEDALGKPTFSKASASFQVEGNTLHFVIGNYADPKEDLQHLGGKFGYYSGQWTAFSSATLWNPVPEQPIKDVMQNDTNDPTNQNNYHSINKKTVLPGEKFEYTISQKVGEMNVTILKKYSTFIISDKLPDEVNYLKNAYVTDDSGKRLDANAGTFTYEDGILKYAFSNDFLANIMPYRGETYTVHIPVQVKNDVKPNIEIKNIARIQIDKDKASTNETVNPTGEDTENKITKKIFIGKFNQVKDWDSIFKSNGGSTPDKTDTAKEQAKTTTKSLKKLVRDADANGDYDGKDVLQDQQKMTGKDDTTDIHFIVQFKFSSHGDYKSLTLLDKLHDAFKYKDAKILTADSKDVTNQGKLDLDSSHQQVTWTANEPNHWRSKTLYMYLTVNLNKDYKYTSDLIDSQTGNYAIPNDASDIIDNNTFTSNQVHVIIPSDSLIPDPVKSVVDQNGYDINHKQVANGDILYYHIDQKVGNLKEDLLKPYKSFGLSDKLDANLKYLDSYVINKETGKKISDSNTTEYDAKTHTVSWTASRDFLDKGMPFKGETYELVIKVQVDDTETLNNIANGTNISSIDGGLDIKNTGKRIINDKPKATNEVENPLKPRVPDKPIKNVVDKDGKDINHKVVSNGDILYYHIDQRVGTLGKDLISRYKKFSIFDKLDGDLDFVKAYLVNKTTKEVLSDPSEVTFDEATNLVTWTASDEFLKSMPLKGETYELIIEAKVNIKDPNQNKTKDSIKNTATVNVDDNPQITNEVENPLTPPDFAPEKTVLNNDGKDINHKTVVNGQRLIYHISKKVGTLGFGLAQRYKEFTIIDKLDKNVQFDSAYVQNADTKAKVSNPSEVSFDKDSNTVKFTASNQFLSQMPLKGETYDFVITVTVNIQDEDLDKDVEIDNAGSVSLDNQPQDTNTVDNHYQPVTPEAPTKSVVNHDGKDINHQIVSNGDTIYYHIDKKVGTLNQDLAQRYKEFSMTDKLDHNLTFIKAYVVNKETGKTVSQPAEITVSDNTVIWKASDNFLKSMPLKGETYELVIEAKVNVSDKTSATDEVTIENIASVSIDNQPQQTNAVDNKLHSKGQAPKPTKKVVNKDGKDINNTTVKVGDTLYYHVDQKVGTLGKDLSERYPQFTIKDQLDKRLTYVNAYVVNKTDGKKMSNDSEISFDESSNTVLFTASPDFLKAMPLKGETYELVIEVKVNKGATTIANAETRSDKSGNKSETSQSNQDDATADQTTKLGTTENGTESDSAADVQLIRNVATSDLGNNPQDTNEVINNLKGDPINNPKDNKQSKDSMPEDEPSYKKMAQTGSKTLYNFLTKILRGLAM